MDYVDGLYKHHRKVGALDLSYLNYIQHQTVLFPVSSAVMSDAAAVSPLT